MFVKWFSEIRKDDIDDAGGKGANLAELVYAGLPVPPGFVVTTAAYRTFVQANDLQGRIIELVRNARADDPTSIEHVSQVIRQLFAQGDIPDTIANAICETYHALPPFKAEGPLWTIGISEPKAPSGQLTFQGQRPPLDNSVAVRSSATAEDLPSASFAGQQETRLNVQGDDALLDAIRDCWSSLWTPRALAYRARQHISPEDVALAVVVQEMVPADASGILFTANPVNGRCDQAVINAAWGLGEAIVGGQVSPDTIIADKDTGEVKQVDIAEKTTMTVLLSEGTTDIPVADELKHARVLNDMQIAQLVRLGREIEAHYGAPQDVEWCWAGDRFYIVQTRPITALPPADMERDVLNLSKGDVPADVAWSTAEEKPSQPFDLWNDSLAGDYLWSNVNFGEAVSDVMTPLSWSVLRLVLEDWIFIPGYESVGNISGRPYLNISVFASVLHALGKSRPEILKALEGTLYMRLPEEIEIPLIPVPRWSLFLILPKLIRTELRQRRGVRRLPAYLAENPVWCRRMRQQIQEAATRAKLVSLWHEAIRPHLAETVWIVLGSVSHATGYTIELRRELTELIGPSDADTLISNLSNDTGLLASLGPVVGLAKVARGEMDRTTYLEQYGHRGPHEFELSVPRPVEDPDWLHRQLAQLRESPPDVAARLAKQRTEFEAAWERFKALYPQKAKSIRRRIDEAAQRNRMREAARSEYVRDRWMARVFALRAGELTGLGDDIFFLAMDEVLDGLAGSETARDYIRARQKTYERYRALPPYPSIIRGRFDPFRWVANPGRRTDIFDASTVTPALMLDGALRTIVGAAGAAGRVEGVVRRLERPEEGDQLQEGEVLVTGQTDIEWTVLFPRAAAIVTDVGAPLSHAAIVARELGIPAVVGCGNATMHLHTGDRVIVDGGKGVVEIQAS